MARARHVFELLLPLALGLAMTAGLAGCRSDKKASSQAPDLPQKPTLRILTLGGAAGAVEPCGCVKDMLGGVDHAAALVASSKKAAGSVLLLGAGSMFFQDPQVEPEKQKQAELKAETMAASLRDIGLVAWAPGANDWALGVDAFRRLAVQAGAHPLALNLPPESGTQAVTQIVERAGLRIGLLGISVPRYRGGDVGFEVGQVAPSMSRGLQELDQNGAQLKVALLAAPRGEALRLVEQSPGLDLAILGKPFDQGEANDATFEPMLLGKTLVVQGQNHLQGVPVVDLFVQNDDHSFVDGSGLERAAARASLTRRIEQLEARLGVWKQEGSTVSPARVQERERDLARLKQQLGTLGETPPPKQGSYFLYDLSFVRETLGADPRVASRLLAYYKQVNELNRELFKDKKPAPVAEGQSSYVGVDVCSTCHQEERAFWNSTPHARAYETLLKDHKQFNLDCVSCHVTGYDQPGGSTVTFVDDLKAVQCENCHGPGSRHVTDPANRELIQTVPSQDLCPTCHHPPHVEEDWTVTEAWPHIIGPGHGY